MAKNWYAWIGSSDQALRGGVHYFEQESVYTRVFKSRPNERFWKEFSGDPYFQPSVDHFEPGIPSVYQYLLATAVAECIKAKRVGWRTNKQEALKRGLEQRVLKGDIATGTVQSPQREIDEFLARDSQYRLNIMLNNMQEILVELVAFLLSRRYGSLSAARCRSLLHMPAVEAFCSSGFSPELAPKEVQDGESILGPTYAFLRYCMDQYRFKYRAEIEAAPRLKAYFFQRKTVSMIRDHITRVDGEIAGFDQPWKLSGKVFSDSLPEIG